MQVFLLFVFSGFSKWETGEREESTYSVNEVFLGGRLRQKARLENKSPRND